MNLRFDSVGGASGDMVLGVLADLGADLGAIATQVHAILHDHFHIHIVKETIGGIAGTKVNVALHDDDGHHHNHHHHSHGRNLPEIVAMLSSAPQHDAAQLAIKVFKRLAEAEAAVHGTTTDKVHFHEVGAVDAIVDIYGSCLALFQLGVTSVSVGPLPEGYGTVKCAHGVMPIPAPATARLLEGHPCERVDEPFELVTPTGAALLMTWKDEFPAIPSPVASAKSGYGFGQRTLKGRPNLLRGTLSREVKNSTAIESYRKLSKAPCSASKPTSMMSRPKCWDIPWRNFWSAARWMRGLRRCR
jgi:uncharacterized protein (DUF111 family)